MVCLCVHTVVCDPPCVNGACVANDTCNCATGFQGERCTEQGTLVHAAQVIMQRYWLRWRHSYGKKFFHKICDSYFCTHEL